MQPSDSGKIKDDFGKFDLRTHVFDARGRLAETNLYRVHKLGDKTYFERPIGSGNVWYENGEAAGRISIEKDEKGVRRKVVNEEEPHKAYSRPPTVSESVQAAHDQMAEKLAAAEAELAAIKAESVKKTQPKQPQTAAAPTPLTLPEIK